MTNTLQFKHFTLTVKTGKAAETKAATVEQPTPAPEPKPPFQYWGVVGLLFVAVIYINAYIYWKRRKKGV